MPEAIKKNQRRQRKAVRDLIPSLIVDELSLRVAAAHGCEFSIHASYNQLRRKVQLKRVCAYHPDGEGAWKDPATFVNQAHVEGNRVHRSPTISALRGNSKAVFGIHELHGPEDVQCAECVKLNRRIHCPEGFQLDTDEIVVFDKPGTVDRYTTIPYLQLDQEGADERWADPNNALMFLGHCEDGKQFSQWGELPCPMGSHLGTRIPWYRLHPNTRRHIRRRLMEATP